MDQNNSQTKALVMGRVRTIHFLQPLFTATILSIVLCVLALWGIGREVWVARVLADAPSFSNGVAVAHFYLAAFMNTRFIVQVLVLVTVAAFVWFAYSISRTFRFIGKFA